MRSALIIVIVFCTGIVSSHMLSTISGFIENTIMILIYVLLLIVGLNLGCSRRNQSMKFTVTVSMLAMPLVTIVGTIIGVSITAAFIPGVTVMEAITASSGFAFYSVSSVIITSYVGVQLGTLALISNIMREVLTIICAPIIARIFGREAPISCAAATAMDTCLPIIRRTSGQEFVLMSLFNGLVLTFAVPFLVPLAISLL